MEVKERRTRKDSPLENPSTGFKYQMLLSKFNELTQETNAKRKHLEALNHEKTNLQAEVRFLRQRYLYLIANQTNRTPISRSRKPIPRQENMRKRKSSSGCDSEAIKKAKSFNSPKIPSFCGEMSLKKRKEGGGCKNAPTFDLNETWREGDESAEMAEEPAAKQQVSGMKASACRNAGNGASRLGKRKILWQDPVALSV